MAFIRCHNEKHIWNDRDRIGSFREITKMHTMTGALADISVIFFLIILKNHTIVKSVFK